MYTTTLLTASPQLCHLLIASLSTSIHRMLQRQVIVDDTVHDWQDGAHIQLDVDAGLEPELFAMMMEGLCCICLYGSFQAFCALP